MRQAAFRSKLDVIAVGLAVFVCLAWLLIFEERFTHGATWSGLNPSGGGPGFLLLLTAGGLSFFLRSDLAKSLEPLKTTLHSGVLAAICGFGFWWVVQAWSGLPSEAMLPLTSAVVGAFFVPRVVASVLNETWKQAESLNSGTEAG